MEVQLGQFFVLAAQRRKVFRRPIAVDRGLEGHGSKAQPRDVLRALTEGMHGGRRESRPGHDVGPVGQYLRHVLFDRRRAWASAQKGPVGILDLGNAVDGAMEPHAEPPPEGHHFVGEVGAIGRAAEVQVFAVLPGAAFSVRHDVPDQVEPQQGFAAPEIHLEFAPEIAAGLEQPVNGVLGRSFVHVDGLLLPLEAMDARQVARLGDIEVQVVDRPVCGQALVYPRPGDPSASGARRRGGICGVRGGRGQ